MKKKFRSNCLITCVLDLIGDKWSLLIIRDMLLEHKKTFKQLSESNEGIAPGILSARLRLLETHELITKRKLPQNKKENIYLLTDKGIDLAPVLAEISFWSDRNLRKLNPKMNESYDKIFKMSKQKSIQKVQKGYRALVKEIVNQAK